MTDYTDLIERLRGNDMPWSVKDAADALEAQAGRIAELEALYDKLHVEWWEVLNARIAELEAALKPFADERHCGNIPSYADDEASIGCAYRAGDLRAARAALEKKND